jgi:hypothetical protein
MPPSALLETLQAIGRKVRLYAIALGTGRIVALAVGLLVVMVFVDWAAHATTLAPGGLPGPARVALLLTAFGLLVFCLVRWIAQPALRKYSPGDVAGWVEERIPQFGDTLRSTVNFLSSDVPGSRVMKERVVSQASQRMSEADLTAVIDPRPVWYSSAGAVGAILTLVVVAIAVGPAFRSIAGSRLFSPLGGQAWPKTVEISMDGNVPERVAVGDPVPIRVKLSKGDRAGRHVIVRYRYDNEPWQEQVMERAPDGAYAANLDTRLDEGKTLGSMQVQIEAGDDEHLLQPITIVPRLDVSLVEAGITAPAYVHAAEQGKVNLSERPAVMAVGSSVDLAIHFNKPLSTGQNVEITPANPAIKLPEIKWDRPAANVAVAHLPATESYRFTIHATDTDNFRNVGAAEYEFIVREDQPPTVQIEEPRRSEDRTAVAEFMLKAVAEDDYGVQAAQLVVQRLGSKATTQPAEAAGGTSGSNKWVIDLVKDNAVAAEGASWQESGGTLERKRFELGYDWDLAKLQNANLKAGDVLEFFVQVKDNFDLNGKQHDWVPSGKLRINIISQEQFNNAVQQAFESLHSQLKELHQSQVRNKAETDALKQATEKKPAFDEADKVQAERIAGEQSNTASQTQQQGQKLEALAQRIKENKSSDASLQQTAESVQKQLQDAAEGAMKKAAGDLNDAREQKGDPKATAQEQQQKADQRSAAMARASDNQQKAADQIRQAMDRLGNFDGLGEFRQKLQEIKAHQEKLEQQFNKSVKDELGKKPEELSNEKKDELKKLAEEQQNLSKQTQNALEQMSKKAEQMEKSDPSSSQAMKQAAQTGNEQQVPGKQSQASQAMQQNQQAQAQQQQKQAEIGLDMIIAKLKEAERRKLEELQAKLAEVQQLVDDLVRRQAGHNIDNVILQGGAKWAKMDLADRQPLMENSARDEKNPQDAKSPKELNTSQRVTERNTRDVAKKAEKLPDPAPAAKLTAAAGHMERAIVHLNEEKLAEAYDPPQVDALATLLEAKKSVDEAMKKVQDQLKQETQDSIKQAYVKLLGDQKKIGKDVRDIDGTPKDNGDLPRPVAIRLGQLPGEQGGLSGRAEKLGEQLEQLDSIVYVWANKDIVSTMNVVKDDLAKPETGTPTQAEETRIEEQLQAMIDSLAVKPQQKEFKDRNKGGKGGGSSKVRMPGEAELRLLKALQQAVNNSTVKIDADQTGKAKEKPEEKASDPDKQKLLALGGRQGELRDLLDKMIQKATQGKMKLGAEPDNKDQLPEEAKKEDVEDQEFEKQLLQDKLTDDQTGNSVKLTGDRMARSRQRLAINDDPGKITQEIQKRIQIDLDNLIKLAQAQQAQSKPGQGQPKPGDKPKPQPGQPQPGPQQAGKGKEHQETGKTPAEQSTLAQGGEPQVDLSQDIKEKMQEWGRLHPRDRDAVLEGSSEKVNAKYQKLVEDYFKSLSDKAAQR